MASKQKKRAVKSRKGKGMGMAGKRSQRRTRRRGQWGGDSASYGFGAAVAPGAPYASEVVAKEACLAVPRPGTLVDYSAGSGGLPGLTRGGGRVSRRKQNGGRWMADPAQTTGGPNPIMPVTRIGCEGGMVDTSPPGAAPNPVPMRQSGGVGGVASPFYQVPTAGYGNTPSTWVSSTGTPSLLQTPYDARAMNPACLKTGGGRKSKRRGSKRRGSKRCY
jgi:hypothetical protein